VDRNSLCSFGDSFADFVEHMPYGSTIWKVDRDDIGSSVLVYANQMSSRQAGVDMVSRIGKTMDEGFPNAVAHVFGRTLLKVLGEGSQQVLDEMPYGDEMFPDAWFKVSMFPLGRGHVAVVYENINRQKELEDQLLRIAKEDALTGLSNVRGFHEHLEEFVNEGHSSAMLFIDLDGFKSVNDTYGHSAGDTALGKVAKRLRREVRQTDYLARIGGDEFGVLLRGLVEGGAEDVAQRIVKAIRGETFLLEDGVEATVGVSVGIRIIVPGDDPGTVFRDADRAMYQAKNSGGNRYYLWRGTDLL